MAPTVNPSVWRSPTEADLAASISAAEVEAYRTAAADEDAHGDPIQTLLTRAVNFVRGYIRTRENIAMGPSGTLPESLIAPAMDYIAFDVVKRVPRANTEDRRHARDAALAIFRDVASGKFTIESWGASETDTPATAAELTNDPMRRVTAERLNGL